MLLLFSSLVPSTADAQELYWEEPRILVESGARFPQAEYGGGVLAVVWQEFSRTGEERGEVTLSLKMRTADGPWYETRNFAGPFSFIGNEAPIFSLTVDANGRILIAVSSGEKAISLYTASMDKPISPLTGISSDKALVAPRIFAKSDGGYLLFTTREWVTDEGGDTLTIFYSLSEDGKNWTELQPLETTAELSLNFLPHHVSAFGREYVAFQVLQTTRGASYQIYLKYSEDGGRTWSEATWLSGFEEYLPNSDNDPVFFNNQRPFITQVSDHLGLAWERAYRRENPQIYFAEVDRDGTIIGEPDQVTGGTRFCNYPQIVTLDSQIYLVWFDDRAGDEHVILANKSGVFWEERDVSRISGISMFPYPIVENEKLYLIWENRRGNTSRLVYLTPDETVTPPTPDPANFIAGERYRMDVFQVRWNLPSDSSGVAGFSYTWSDNQDSEPPKELQVLQNVRQASFSAKEDGMWYFHIRAQDYAGNWSEPNSVSVYRDTTPPNPVDIVPPDRDPQGFLKSNSFLVEWNPPPGEEYIGGYSYTLEYMGPLSSDITSMNVSLSTPPTRVITSGSEVFFNNRDDGYWAFTVRAIDTVGNAGRPKTIFFKLNKYIPVTYITRVSVQKDKLGRINFEIRGRGFSVGGNITEVILDRDGQRPYDYTFPGDLELYTVVNDRLIVGPEIEDINEGVYRVGLIHPERGTYFTRPYLELEPSGTVKFGDFRTRIGYEWKRIKDTMFSFSINELVLWTVLMFLGMVLVFSSAKLAHLVHESRTLRMEVEALITQKELPVKKRQERIYMMKKRGMGLRIKFIFFITTIIIVVVIGVSLYLGNFMIQTQRQNLTDGLAQQVEVLLESLAAGARENLPRKDVLALDSVISQRTAMDDALYATITGQGETDPDQFNYIWATDDINIDEKIEGEQLELGRTPIQDTVASNVPALRERINQEATDSVSMMTEELNKLAEQAVELARRGDEESARLLQEYQQEITTLENRVNQELRRIGDVIGSQPTFDETSLNPDTKTYTFYKPVVYFSRGEQYFYRGLVRVGVSVERILQEISNSREELIITTVIISAIAIGFGIVGAILFSSIMIIPITRLVQGVEKIRDTEDKEALKDHQIVVRSRDEIFTLAETVNQMTQGLVKAAAANKDLTVGKEVQKMFIPLEKDRSGSKLTTGKEENDKVSFFGYYEGAKGVSGDYFDFRKLDDKHYAIIKCDVAGKGVPASLIMVEVATIFLDYFRNWSIKREGINLEKLVYNMNDLIEERGFKGRFAALIVVILNIETGACYFCNAGDNLVHIYDKGTGGMMKKVLPEAPAAGVFPSMLVEMQSGFKQIPHQLKSGDTLFLFTDGVEEAQRKFRDSSFNLTTCQEEGIEEGEAHGNHNIGSEFEELGIPRIYDIVNAVFNKSQFRLEKYHNPVGDEELTFDFSTCGETVEEAVLALVAVEKIFRIYPAPDATVEDKISVDKPINAFLQKHFLQYETYFHSPGTTDELDEYISFSYLKEDEQFDDLTILGIKKR